MKLIHKAIILLLTISASLYASTASNPILQPFTSNPVDNSTGLALDANIVLDFDTDIVNFYIDGRFELYRNDGTLIEAFNATSPTDFFGTANGNAFIVGDKITINPFANLVFGTSYYVLIPVGSNMGNPNDSAAKVIPVTLSTTYNFTVGVVERLQYLRDNTKEVVLDTTTNLIWQDDATSATKTWKVSLDYCENLALGGYDDWRLPNIEELSSLIDYTVSVPTIDSLFINTVSAGYWSSTTDVGDTYKAWQVNFYEGIRQSWLGTGNGKTYSLNVRCVRSGGVPTFDSAATVSVNENQTSAVTLNATNTNTYSISGGDSASFDVDSSSGLVTFKVAPDYESVPNTYTFTATATDNPTNVTTQDVTITILDVEEAEHNGVHYGTVVSPYTGKTWLDRNLGALQVCTALSDTACYGDYYQWGRNTDGHEKSGSATTGTQAVDINSAGTNFIIKSNDWITGSTDWTTEDSDGALRSANWSKTDGTSVCPIGYRVPTIGELADETIDNNASDAFENKTDAFNNFLKFPSAHYRNYSGGYIGTNASYGVVSSSSVHSTSTYISHYLDFYTSARITENSRAYGNSVRCIKAPPSND
ncbi:MAG: hypothetical protein ACI9TV_000494 [Sulfurimonas sp.]|jgi:hypothetical protein|uniref:Lcl domain-containing protein n=1 Tax=Sulfurimonas sp. TaxID=2022749 RepID=UPI0039E3B1E4